MPVLSFWQIFKLGLAAPFFISLAGVVVIFLLWIMGLCLEEQESSRSFKNLLFANLTARQIQFSPHGRILRRAALFLAVFFAIFMLRNGFFSGLFELFYALLKVLGALFLVILGLNNYGFIYFDRLFKGSQLESARTFTYYTAGILGLTLGATWHDRTNTLIQRLLGKGNFVELLGFSLGMVLTMFLLAVALNLIFNIFTRLRKIREPLLRFSGLIFILIGIMILLGKCPFLG